EQSETSRPGTDFVQPKIRDDAQQPRTERLAFSERAQLAIRADKCLLRDVLGRRRVAHDEIRGAKRHLLISLDERAERSRIAPPGARDRLAVFTQRAVHSRYIHQVRPSSSGGRPTYAGVFSIAHN